MHFPYTIILKISFIASVRSIITLLAFLFLCFQISFAQIDFRKFEMDSFRLPDIHRRTLTGSASLLARHSEWKHENFLGKESSTLFNPGLRINFNQFKNTSIIQATRSIMFDGNYRRSNDNRHATGDKASTYYRTSMAYS